jgi:receptor protein-tyrosine kinase
MDAARAWTLTRRWWWLLIIGTVFAIAAYGIAARIRDRHPAPPVYAATARLFVSLNASSGDDPAIVDRPFDMDRLLYTYTTMLSGHAVAARAASNLDVMNAPDDLSARISVEQPKNTQLIDVTTRGATAADADALSFATVAAFMQLRIEQRLPGDVALYEAVPAAREASGTSEPIAVALVALAGLVGAAAIILAFEYLSDAVRDDREAVAAAGLPALATIPPLARSASRVATDAHAIDRYRFLRTNVAVSAASASSQVILVAGPRAGAGATETAANYAASLAAAGQRVVLIDADLRRGCLGARFASEIPHGLADALALDLPVYGLVDATDIDGLSLVVAGAHTPESTELLESPRLGLLLRELRERFDAIVIDAPPLLDTADATLLAAQSDAIIIAARCERTTRADLAQAAVALHRLDARVLGCVLTGDPSAAKPFRFRLPRPRASQDPQRESVRT